MISSSVGAAASRSVPQSQQPNMMNYHALTAAGQLSGMHPIATSNLTCGTSGSKNGGSSSNLGRHLGGQATGANNSIKQFMGLS